MSITQTVDSFFKELKGFREVMSEKCGLVRSDFDDCYGNEIKELEVFMRESFLKDLSEESYEFYELQEKRYRLAKLNEAKSIIFEMCGQILKVVFLGNRSCRVIKLYNNHFSGDYPRLDNLKGEAKIVYDFCCKHDLVCSVGSCEVNRKVDYFLRIEF